MTALRPLDLATPSTRGNSYITDIAVTFLLDDDPWLPTAAWVRLLTALEVPSATARTALHRMDKGGFLDRQVRMGAPGYRMSPRWQELVRTAEPPSTADIEAQTRWTLVTFSVPESRRAQRHVLRTVLDRAGLAPLGNGIWIGPEVVLAQVRRLVGEAGLSGYVDCFLGEHAGSAADGGALAARCWDLEAVQQEFAHLEARAREALTRFEEGQSAFVTLVSYSNALRRLQTRAPALPSRLLPAGGSRPAAERAVRELLAVRLPAARAWVEVLRGAVATGAAAAGA